MNPLDDLRSVLSVEAEDVCRPDELLARLRSPRRNRGLLVTAAVAVVLVLAGVLVVALRTPGTGPATTESGSPAQTVSPTESASPTPIAGPPLRKGPWRTYRGPGFSLRYPQAWHITRYHGIVATVVFPMFYVGAQQLTGPCVTPGSNAPPAACGDWFSRSWRVPRNGVLVLWLETELPGKPFWGARGHRTRINGHPARVYRGAPVSCPVAGTTSEINATIAMGRHIGPRQPYSSYHMWACFGAHATPDQYAAVQRMLHSARIRG